MGDVASWLCFWFAVAILVHCILYAGMSLCLCVVHPLRRVFSFIRFLKYNLSPKLPNATSCLGAADVMLVICLFVCFYRHHGYFIDIMIVVSTSWLFYRHHGCFNDIMVVLSTSWLLYRHHGCFIDIMVVLSTSWLVDVLEC